MESKVINGYELRPIGNNTDELADLIFDSWKADSRRSVMFMEYNKDWLDWNFNAPGQDRDFLVGAYRNGRLYGFTCGLNRSVIYKGSITGKALVGTLLTVHPGHRRKRIAWNMIEYMKTKFLDQGYDLFYGYLFARRASAPLIKKLTAKYKKPLGVKVTTMLKGKYMVKVLERDALDSAKGIDALQKWYMRRNSTMKPINGLGEMRSLCDADIPVLLKMFNSYRNKVDLARAWKENELRWFFNHPPVSQTVVYEEGGRVTGAINFYRINIWISGSILPMVEIDNMLLPESSREAASFLFKWLEMVKEEGVVIASAYNTKYYDMTPFKENLFITYPRVLMFLGHSFNPDIRLDRVNSSTMDFR